MRIKFKPLVYSAIFFFGCEFRSLCIIEYILKCNPEERFG